MLFICALVALLVLCFSLQHGVQLIGQVIEHAANVVQDAHCALILSQHAKTSTHTFDNVRRYYYHTLLL